MGAPDDESEAEMIVDHVGEAESKAPSHKITKREEVEAIISEVLKEIFGLSEDQLRQRHEAFQSIAADERRRRTNDRAENEGPRRNQACGAGRLATGSNQRQPPPVSSSF